MKVTALDLEPVAGRGRPSTFTVLVERTVSSVWARSTMKNSTALPK